MSTSILAVFFRTACKSTTASNEGSRPIVCLVKIDWHYQTSPLSLCLISNQTSQKNSDFSLKTTTETCKQQSQLDIFTLCAMILGRPWGRLFQFQQLLFFFEINVNNQATMLTNRTRYLKTHQKLEI